MLYQFLLVGIFVAVSILSAVLSSFVLGLCGFDIETTTEICKDIALLIYFLMLFLLIFGPANKHTANDNTSGVTTLLDIMASLPLDQRDKVAFVFFDLEEAGLFGSSSFASKHKDIRNNRLVLIFDCVSAARQCSLR